MAGGRGSRFWPLSQPQIPKQFLNIPPIADGKTLIQATIQRFEKLVPLERILVVGLAEHEAILREQLQSLPAENLLLEPFGRNTAASVAIGALAISARTKQKALQLVLPADHHIVNVGALHQAIDSALELFTKEEKLLTFGIEPRWPEVGYGYIESAELLGNFKGSSIYAAQAFKEKPTRQIAESYLRAGNYLWNSGMFFWPVTTILEELQNFLPSTLNICRQFDLRPSKNRVCLLTRDLFEKLENISIDYAILEKSKRVVVIRSPLHWNDLGGWESVYQLLDKTPDNNVLRAEKILTNQTTNSLFYCNGLEVIADSVDGLVIAYHQGKLLICKRERVGEIRALVEKITKLP